MALHTDEFYTLMNSGRFDTVYEATVWVAQEARKKANSVDNLVLQSEAINWVLTGKEPPMLEVIRNIRKERKPIAVEYLEDVLKLVDDDGVKYSVKVSISESKKENHLIYNYTDVNDEYRRTRIRVLCRMIWHHIS